MSRVVTLEDFTPGERFDGNPWTGGRMEEAPAIDGPFSPLETFVFGAGTQPAPDADPREPQSRNFTTSLAQLDEGYYRIVFTDSGGNEQAVGPIFVPSATQAYTSIQSVRRVLSPDGSQDASLGTAASLSDNEIEGAIEEAATEINARLGGRYTLPFEQTPPLVEKLNRDIAAYLATLVYRRGKPIPSGDPILLRYARAEEMLKSAASGTIELVSEKGEETSGTSGDAAVENLFEGDLFDAADFSLGPVRGNLPWLPGRLGPY